MLTGCGSIPTGKHNTSQSSPKYYELSNLAKIFTSTATQKGDKSGFVLLRDGHRALNERLYLAEFAEHTIDVQYYIWNSDKSGKRLSQKLIEAADRGVSVRIILDDFSVGDRNEQLLAVNSHPNIQIRVYNPFVNRSGAAKWLNFAFDFERLNRRMHNKTYTADGVAAIVGGRNIGDEYFNSSENLNFRDLDLFTVGPVVQQVSQSFQEYWDSPWAISIEHLVSSNTDKEGKNQLDALLADKQTELSQISPSRKTESPESHFIQTLNELVWAPAVFIYDQPGGENKKAYSEGPKRVASHLLQLAENSEKEILIESAYFVLDEPALQIAARLRDRGVKMQALTNSMASNDVLPNHASYAMVREDMLKQGIKLYELRPDARSCLETVGQNAYCDEDSFLGLHAKAAVFDRQTIYVGSCNLNLRSAYLNTEVGMFVESPVLAKMLIQQIELNLRRENSWQPVIRDGQILWLTETNGIEETSTHEPQTSWLERVKEGFLILVPGAQYY
jgi:putative cardiolipin synthase